MSGLRGCVWAQRLCSVGSAFRSCEKHVACAGSSCMVPYQENDVDGRNVDDLLKRFALRLKTSTHSANCPYSLPGSVRFTLQKELDLSQEIVLTEDFAAKSKKLIIMRGGELVRAIEASYKCI